MKKLSFLLSLLFLSVNVPAAQAGLFDDLWKKAKDFQEEQEKLARDRERAEAPAPIQSALPAGEVDLPVNTNSSCFAMKGHLDGDVTAAVIRVRKEDSDAKAHPAQWAKLKSESGKKAIEEIVCLPDGPGSYQVKLVASKTPPTASNSYYLDVPVRTSSVENLDPRPFNRFLYPSSNVQSHNRELQDLAKTITRSARTDREKALLVHEWVAKNIRYDVDGYFAYLAGDEARSFQNKSLDALTMLRIREGVCQGYSYLAAALLRVAGVPARVVQGQASQEAIEWNEQNLKDDRYGHAWNEFFVNGKWEPMDITWDSGHVDYDTKEFSFSYRESLFGDSEEFRKSHVRTLVLEE